SRGFPLARSRMSTATRRRLAIAALASTLALPALAEDANAPKAPAQPTQPAPAAPPAQPAPAAPPAAAPVKNPAPPAEAPPAYGKNRGRERASARWQRDDAQTGVAWRPAWSLPLMQAAANGDLAAVKTLLAAGKDVNEKSPKQRLTALHAAVHMG